MTDPHLEITYDVQPPYHVELRQDGSVWVEGDGLSLQTDSVHQALAFIGVLETDQETALNEYLEVVGI